MFFFQLEDSEDASIGWAFDDIFTADHVDWEKVGRTHVITLLNKTCDRLNRKIMERYGGAIRTFYAEDSLVDDESTQCNSRLAVDPESAG